MQCPDNPLRNAVGSPRWLDEATRLGDATLARFADTGGGFFYTSSDHEPLIARKKDLWDTPVPSSTGQAATAFLRLARHTGRDDYRRAVEETLRVSIGWMERASLGVGQLLITLDAWLATRKEAVARMIQPHNMETQGL